MISTLILSFGDGEETESISKRTSEVIVENDALNINEIISGHPGAEYFIFTRQGNRVHPKINKMILEVQGRYVRNQAAISAVNKFNLDDNSDVYLPGLYALPDLKANYALNLSKQVGRTLTTLSNLVTIGASGFVITKELLEKVYFPFKINEFNLEILFISALETARFFEVLPKGITSYTKYENDLVDSATLFNKYWYLGYIHQFRVVLDHFYEQNKQLSKYFQRAFLYALQWRLLYAANTSYKQIFNDAEIDEFWGHVSGCMKFINPEIVLGVTWHSNIPKSALIELLRLGGRKFSSVNSKNNIEVYVGETLVQSFREAKVTFELMKVVEDELIIYGYLIAPMQEGMRLGILINNQETLLEDTNRYTDYRVFGRTLFRHHTFDISIPLSVFSEKKSKIEFQISYDDDTDTRVKPRLNFRKQLSKLIDTEVAYWKIENKIFRYHPRAIKVSKANFLKHFFYEVLFLAAIVYNAGFSSIKVLTVRIAYYISRAGHKYRKPIWLFADKMYKAGDNGEYAYRFAQRQDDGIKKYYVLDRKSKDKKRLRKEGVKFVKYGGLRHKLLFLNAETIFLTHTFSVVNNSFPKGFEKYFRGLFNSRIIFIQHGLSIQFLPRIQNRAYDGVDYYCVSSSFEELNMQMPDYGYKPGQIVRTGMARYDGLVSKPEKLLLISPTWRNYLAMPTDPTNSKRRQRAKSNVFSQSKYFEIYKTLITDNELLEAARDSGYKILFLLHPILSSQLEDFDEFQSDDMEIVAATDEIVYEDLLTRASILLTDYSGIQFDFAFMQKPVVYYHPEDLPPSYEEAYYKYSRDALGPIYSENDSLVRHLVKLMKEGAEMSSEYLSKVDEFFYYHDRNNSQRIYDLAYELTKKDEK